MKNPPPTARPASSRYAIGDADTPFVREEFRGPKYDREQQLSVWENEGGALVDRAIIPAGAQQGHNHTLTTRS